jgi:alpha-galactosidase
MAGTKFALSGSCGQTDFSALLQFVTMAEFLESEIIACRVSSEIRLDAGNPAKEWESAQPVRFDANWQGRDSDPALETEVRVLWSPEIVYLKFACRYRELFVFEDSDPNGRRDHLWDRDVAEAFLQPEPSPERYYKEFEIAPNGMWIDLDIAPSGLADLKSGLSRSVHVDEPARNWVAEMAIPMKAITAKFDPGAVWRANFYRVEGKAEPRQYLAWQPTHTPQPNFHVPQAFGTLRFAG